MSATDELRALLDERGVAHADDDVRDYYAQTEWVADDGRTVRFTELSFDAAGRSRTWLYFVDGGSFAPEQAVAATLGRGTCRDVHEPPRHGAFWPSPHFKCSECGRAHVSLDYVCFCPGCGREVVA